MSEYRFVAKVNNTAKPTSGYAPRIPDEDWAEHEDLIRKLHDESVPRETILEKLSSLGLQATSSQLALQMKKWNLTVYKVRRRRPAGTGQSSVKDLTAMRSRRMSYEQPLKAEMAPETAIKIMLTKWADTYPYLATLLMSPQQEINMYRFEMFVDVLCSARLFNTAFSLYKVLFRWSLETIGVGGELKHKLLFRSVFNCFQTAVTDAQRSEAAGCVDAVAESYPAAGQMLREFTHPHPQQRRQLPLHTKDRHQVVPPEFDSHLHHCHVPLDQADTTHFIPCLIWCITCMDDLERPDRADTYCNITDTKYDDDLLSTSPELLHSYLFWYLFKCVAAESSLPFRLTLRFSGRDIKVSLPQMLSIAATVLVPRLPTVTRSKISLRGSDSWIVRLLEDDELLARALLRAVERHLEPVSDYSVLRFQVDESRITENFACSSTFDRVILQYAELEPLGMDLRPKFMSRAECLGYLKSLQVQCKKASASPIVKPESPQHNISSPSYTGLVRPLLPLIDEKQEHSRSTSTSPPSIKQEYSMNIDSHTPSTAAPYIPPVLAPRRTASTSSSLRSFLSLASRINAPRSSTQSNRNPDQMSINSRMSWRSSWAFRSSTDVSRPPSSAMALD